MAYDSLKQYIETGFSKALAGDAGVYPASLHTTAEGTAFMADAGDRDLVVAQKTLGFSGNEFEAGGTCWTAAEETHENALVLRKRFPFTAPSPILTRERTVGVGDRLGIATPGHIRVFNRYDAYPVFAQQSIRELNLTERDFENVLDCASFAVFRENFTKGFGADGDHLKTPEEVEYALRCGYSMITLDCSEHIRNDAAKMTDDEVLAAYVPDPSLEEKYLGKEFTAGGFPIRFDGPSFRRMSLIYNDAINFAVSIWQRYFEGKENAPDFEISIDETETPTDPAQHFYVASELISRGVRPATVAPRFCGEFQKGIDYIGDVAQFEKEFKEHAAIADHFGYKISVHSGSDKFSVFEIVGRCSGGRFHVKTAGTNWLEAMQVIAEHDPALYREIHKFALDEAFAEATKYYHVTTDLSKIPPLDTLSDQELPSLFGNNDARQLIHITYGLILSKKDADGKYVFKDRLYAAWRKYAEEYADRLEKHIGKHLALLYDGVLASAHTDK